MPILSSSAALQGLDQQAFNNRQTAQHNALANQMLGIDIQQKQLALKNQQNEQNLWQKLQSGGAPDGNEQNAAQVKQLTQDVQETDKETSMLKQMAKLAPTPEKALAYSKAASDLEKKSADTQTALLNTVAKRVSIQSGIANGAMQVDSQPGWDYYRAMMLQNHIPLIPGVTGNWQHDKPIVQAMAHQVDKQKDILTMKMNQIKIDQAAQREKDTQDYHTQSLAIRRSDEALKREKLSFDKGKKGTVKDPKIALQKDLNTIQNEYRGVYNRLIKDRDKASNASGKEVVNERIKALNANYEQQKRDTAAAHGLPVGEAEQGQPKTASDFMSKYGLQ